jgi:pyrroline-5-carboxylate reductase
MEDGKALGIARSRATIGNGRIILVGCGRMGQALLWGWLKAGVPPAAMTVLEPSPSEALLQLADRTGLRLRQVAEPAPDTTVIVAVKPQKAAELGPLTAAMIQSDTLVISIMAGKTIEDLRHVCPGAGAYIRVMPNLPIAVGRGATVAFAGDGCMPKQTAMAEQLFGSMGLFEWVNPEALIDVATGLAGSGPAYLFYLAECLTKAGADLGLRPEMAERVARATISGAGEMLRQSERSAAELRSEVTSPSGTTAAGLQVLMQDDVLQDLISRTVTAAADRSRELARS